MLSQDRTTLLAHAEPNSVAVKPCRMGDGLADGLPSYPGDLRRGVSHPPQRGGAHSHACEFRPPHRGPLAARTAAPPREPEPGVPCPICHREGCPYPPGTSAGERRTAMILWSDPADSRAGSHRMRRLQLASSGLEAPVSIARVPAVTDSIQDTGLAFTRIRRAGRVADLGGHHDPLRTSHGRPPSCASGPSACCPPGSPRA